MENSENKEVACSSQADPQFDYLANNLAQLLETARRELERDRGAAKASLVTASSLLQSEMERRSRGRTTRTSAMAGWQMARAALRNAAEHDSAWQRA